MVRKTVGAKLDSTSTIKAQRIKGGKYLAEPKCISHYTTIGGMMGIVEKACVWASNVSYLNDREELVHGLRGATKAIESVMSERAYATWAVALRSIVREIKAGRMPNTYAACFCAGSDVLSQWRGYGGSEQGISITFDRAALEAMLSFQKAKLYPVVYGDLRANKQITDELKTNLEELTIFEYAVGDYSLADRRQKAYQMLSRLLPQFKNEDSETNGNGGL